MKTLTLCVHVVAAAVVVYMAILVTTVECFYDMGPLDVLCQTENNITDAELEAFPRYFDPADIEMKFKCFTRCLMKYFDVLDAAGQVDGKKLSQSTDESQHHLFIEIVDECKAKYAAESDSCEQSFGIFSCVMRYTETADDGDL